MASPNATAPSAPAATLVARQLELILASRHLAGSERLKRFLRLVVEETIAGRGSTLKEYTIGVQVYDRGEAFDPRGDSIVRGEANRLRGRIADYYADPATRDEVRIELPKGSYVPTFSPSPPAGRVARAPFAPATWVARVAVLAAAIITGILAGRSVRAPQSSSTGVVRAELGIASAADLYGGGDCMLGEPLTLGGSRTALAWTPDGRRLVFAGRRDGVQQLYVRNIDRGEARALTGTERAQLPAVSPDGQSVVFWAPGEIKRVPIDGGPVQTIDQGLDFPPAGITAGVTGRVIFGYFELYQVGPGSTPETKVTTRATGEYDHVLPQLVADDTVVLFTARTTPWTWGTERVIAQVLATGQRKLLLPDAADARYVPPGYLVFLRRGQLMAVPFDLARLEVTGDAIDVLDGVSQALTGGNSVDVIGAGQFSVSPQGALAYVAGPIVPYPPTTLAAVDRQGRICDLEIETRSYGSPIRVAPDGGRLAVLVRSLTELSLWGTDLTRGSMTKLSAGGEAAWPQWTPDGQRVAFLWSHDGVTELVWQRADGSAPPERLGPGDLVPSSWSPDGHHLAVFRNGDIWIVTPGTRPAALARVTETPETEESPEFSPDGRWLAYSSDETGRSEVYLRPYPGPGAPVPVSINGGGNQAWNPTGNGELFFLALLPGSSRQFGMMAVSVTSGRPGTPRLLFESADPRLGLMVPCAPIRCYDVAPDGEQFFTTKRSQQEPAPLVTQVHVVLNWVEELKAKVPMGRGR